MSVCSLQVCPVQSLLSTIEEMSVSFVVVVVVVAAAVVCFVNCLGNRWSGCFWEIFDSISKI